MNAAYQHPVARWLGWIALSACLYPAVGTAQQSGSSEPDRVHTVLFAVTAPGSPHTSYLFGTHHAFGARFFDSLNVAREKLLASDVLIVENLGSAEAIVNARSTHTDWSAYLSRTDLAYLHDLFTTSDVDLDRLTPAELHTVLARRYAMYTCKARSLADSSRTLDGAIATLAGEQGLELVGLETAAAQLEMLRMDVEGMPRKVHKRRLSAAIEQIRSGGTAGCTEVERYAKLDQDLRLSAPCTNALLLTDRNSRWMARIGPLVRERNCFIAVGLSHMMYGCGLIVQLRALGFRVEPISPVSPER